MKIKIQSGFVAACLIFSVFCDYSVVMASARSGLPSSRMSDQRRPATATPRSRSFQSQLDFSTFGLGDEDTYERDLKAKKKSHRSMMSYDYGDDENSASSSDYHAVLPPSEPTQHFVKNAPLSRKERRRLINKFLINPHASRSVSSRAGESMLSQISTRERGKDGKYHRQVAPGQDELVIGADDTSAFSDLPHEGLLQAFLEEWGSGIAENEDIEKAAIQDLIDKQERRGNYYRTVLLNCQVDYYMEKFDFVGSKESKEEDRQRSILMNILDRAFPKLEEVLSEPLTKEERKELRKEAAKARNKSMFTAFAEEETKKDSADDSKLEFDSDEKRMRAQISEAVNAFFEAEKATKTAADKIFPAKESAAEE